MVTIEGPRFSSRSESKMFRMWGGDVINMTTVPEVVLAKEAGLCYAAIALATDYDCWRDGEEAVSGLIFSQFQVCLTILKSAWGKVGWFLQSFPQKITHFGMSLTQYVIILVSQLQNV